MLSSPQDFASGSCCYLCGRYFENPEFPDEIYSHGERVTCIECYEKLTPEGQTSCIPAKVKTKKETV